MFMKENMHSLKQKLNPCSQFKFTGVECKKMFVEIDDLESVFFPKEKPHCKQIKLFVSILLQGLEHAGLMPSTGGDSNNEEIIELENVVEYYKEIETTFSLYLTLLD